VSRIILDREHLLYQVLYITTYNIGLLILKNWFKREKGSSNNFLENIFSLKQIFKPTFYNFDENIKTIIFNRFPIKKARPRIDIDIGIRRTYLSYKLDSLIPVKTIAGRTLIRPED
jgi:hypothetical protein